MDLRRLSSSSGVSLTELLVAVAIIGLLAGLAIPTYGRWAAKSKQSEAKANLLDIYAAEQTFHAENQRYGSLADIGWAPLKGNGFYGYCLALDNDNCVAPPLGVDFGAGDFDPGSFGDFMDGMNTMAPVVPASRVVAVGSTGLPLLAVANGVLLAVNDNTNGGGPEPPPIGDDDDDNGGMGGGSSGNSGSGGSAAFPVGNPHYTDETFEADAYGVVRTGRVDCWFVTQTGSLVNYNPGI